MNVFEDLLTKLIQKLKDLHYKLKVYTNPESKRLKRLFFAYLDAVKIYKEHLDIVLLDYIYKTNRFCILLLNICAVTGNKKTI